MNSRYTPERIVICYLPDETNYFPFYLWASFFVLTFPTPVRSESSSVPFDYCLRFSVLNCPSEYLPGFSLCRYSKTVFASRPSLFSSISLIFSLSFLNGSSLVRQVCSFLISSGPYTLSFLCMDSNYFFINPVKIIVVKRYF